MASKSTTNKTKKTTKSSKTTSKSTKRSTPKVNKEVEKEIKGTKKIDRTNKLDNTEDLSNTFVSDVGQRSAVFSLEDEIVEEREQKKKAKVEGKRSPFKTFLLMVICLAVGIAACYCYLEVLTDKGNDQTAVKCKPNKKTKIGYDKDSVALDYLISDYDYIGAFQVNLYNYLYSADEINVKDLDQDYLKLLALKKADTDRDNEVSSIEFNDAVNYLFGGDIEFKNNEISTNDMLCSDYEYKEGNYVKKEKDCEGESNLRLQRKIVDVKEEKNKLEVTVVIAILDEEDNKVGKSLTLDESGGQSLSGILEDVEAKAFVIDTEVDNLNKYVYTFKYSSLNKNYYLENIKLDS